MNLLRSVFLESVVLLLVVEAAAIAVVLAIHRSRMTAGTRKALYGTLAVCVLLLVLQHLVQTDREQIEATVAEIAYAIDAGDVPAVGERLDAEFTDRGLDKAEWVEDLRQRLQRWRIDEAKVAGFNTVVEGDTATTSFRAFCDWRGGERTESSVLSAWKLGFVRRADGWKLQRVLSAKFGPGGAIDYAAILQY